MKIKKSKLKEIIRHEINVLMSESYRDAAANYEDPYYRDQLRFGKGLSSYGTSDGDDFPGWNKINKAINIIFEEMVMLHSSSKSFQQDKRLLSLIYVVRDFVKKNSNLELEEVIYRHTQDMWESVMNLAEYLQKNMPSYIQKFKPEVHRKLASMIEFVRQVAAARWGSMSVGYPLKGMAKDLDIPSELR